MIYSNNNDETSTTMCNNIVKSHKTMLNKRSQTKNISTMYSVFKMRRNSTTVFRQRLGWHLKNQRGL